MLHAEVLLTPHTHPLKPYPTPNDFALVVNKRVIYTFDWNAQVLASSLSLSVYQYVSICLSVCLSPDSFRRLGPKRSSRCDDDSTRVNS